MTRAASMPIETRPVALSTVAAIACALAASWIAAGSTGLLGHSLRHVLTWIFTGAFVVAAWPGGGRALWRGVAMCGAALLLVLMTPSILPAVNVAGVLAVVGVAAYFSEGRAGRLLRMTTSAIAVFVVFRAAMQTIPTVWLVADRISAGFGHVAGFLTGQKLWVGPTFGGIDFLVLSGAFYLFWLMASERPRGRRAVYGAAGILVAHFAYLCLLSFAPAFLKDVPVASKEMPNPVWVVPAPPAPTPGQAPAHGMWDLSLKLDAVAVRQFVPNHLPVFGVLFHLLAVGALIRWGRGSTTEISGTEKWKKSQNAEGAAFVLPPKRAAGFFVGAGALAAAALLPVVVTYCTPARSLEGKKIVVSDRLFGNFLKPQNGDYGHLSIGMYGDIQPFIESLGGTAVVSSNLSDEDMKDADALVLIYPNKPFASDATDHYLRLADVYLGTDLSNWVQQLEIDRIWKWVDNGGTLLVMGEHTVMDENMPPGVRSRLNQVLAPSAIRVNYDSAMFEIGGWLQSYEALSHPITAGIEDSRNQFGVVIGASLDVKFPARPVLVGRWGWADPGDEGNGASMMGNHQYDPGERLGDMVLVAEQSFGKGRLVAFGDPSNVTNGITIGAHPFNARLYSYLAHNPATDKDGLGGTPQTAWRQVLGFLLAVLLIVLLGRDLAPMMVVGVVLALSGSLWFWNWEVGARAELLPDGRKLKSSEIYVDKGKTQPSFSGLAYIDNSHLGFYSEESWRTEGTMGLAMNLMRNGYLTLMAPDLNRERLIADADELNGVGIKASLLVMPAPTRALSKQERANLKEWVSNGGKLILTVGWDRYESNRQLLADYGFYLEKIPLDAFPTEVVEAVRKAKPGYEILDGGVNSEGVYVFDVRSVNGKYGEGLPQNAFEITVHPEDFHVTEKTHTLESLHHAMVLRGAIAPEPLGYFKVPYLTGIYVRFHAAWPIRCIDPKSVVAANGRDELPVIIWRSEGKGKVVLIGDSEFATNQNLENEGGQPFEGMRENADFWRWLISYYIRGEKDWWHPTPPAPPAAEKKASDGFDLEGK